jgi:hypothetical protein
MVLADPNGIDRIAKKGEDKVKVKDALIKAIERNETKLSDLEAQQKPAKEIKVEPEKVKELQRSADMYEYQIGVVKKQLEDKKASIKPLGATPTADADVTPTKIEDAPDTIQSVTPDEAGITPEEMASFNKFVKQEEEKAEAGQSKFEKATTKAKAEISQDILKQKSFNNAKDLSESDITNLTDKSQAGLLKIMTLRQIDESLPKVLVGAAKKAVQLPFIKKAIRVAVEKIPAYRNKLMREAQPVVELIQGIIADSKLGQSEAENLQVVMKEATIAQVDPSTKEGRIVDPDLAKAFDSLSPKSKQAYRAIRNYYKKQMEGVVSDIKKGAREVLHPELDAAAIANIDALVDEQFGKALKIRPYFPLRRFGNFWFQVGEDSDPDKEFYTFESINERNKFINIRRRELAEQGIEKRINSGTEFIKNMGQKLNNPGFELIRQIESRIDSITDEESIKNKAMFAKELKENLQQLSYLMMPEGNFRKMFINRKGVKGASSDLLRVFSTSAVNLAYQRTRVRYSQEFNENMVDGIKAVSALPAGEQKDFYEKVTAEINRPERRSQILGLEPTTTGQAIANMMTNLGFFTFLSSPSSAALNVFGMTAIGIPIASSKYGYAKITGALTKYISYYSATPIKQVPARDENGRPAVRSIVPDLGKSPDLTPIQRRAYETLVEDNVIDTSYTYDMAGMTERPVPLDESNTQKFMRYTSALFHHSERMNRSALGLAIFDAAYEKTGNFDFAIREAKNLTFRALGDFTRATKAPIFSSPIGKVAFQFKSYPLQMTYIMLRDFKVMTGITNDITPQALESQLREDGATEEEIAQAVTKYKKEIRQFKKEAAKNFFGVMGLTTVLGGLAAGFPLYSAMAALIETMSQIDDEDEPYEPIYDFDTWFYNWMTTEMGLNNRVAAAVIRGVPAEYAGLGLSDRVSLDILKLWFRDGLDRGDDEAYLYSLIISNLGPAVSILANTAKASNFIRDGEWYRAVEVIMPAIIKSPMMSARYAEEGAKTRSGEYYIKPGEITDLDLFIRAIGFAPEKVLREQKALIKKKGLMSKVDQEKASIHRAIVNAMVNGDLAEIQRVFKKADRFNKKYPGIRPISPLSVQESMASKTKNLLEKDLLDGLGKNYYFQFKDDIKVIGEEDYKKGGLVKRFQKGGVSKIDRDKLIELMKEGSYDPTIANPNLEFKYDPKDSSLGYVKKDNLVKRSTLKAYKDAIRDKLTKDGQIVNRLPLKRAQDMYLTDRFLDQDREGQKLTLQHELEHISGQKAKPYFTQITEKEKDLPADEFRKRIIKKAQGASAPRFYAAMNTYENVFGVPEDDAASKLNRLGQHALEKNNVFFKTKLRKLEEADPLFAKLRQEARDKTYKIDTGRKDPYISESRERVGEGVLNKYIAEKYDVPINSMGYIGRLDTKTMGSSFEEAVSDLSSIEIVKNIDLTTDPILRELIFNSDPELIQVYKAVTGLRTDRLDPRDLPPFTAQNIKGSEEEEIRMQVRREIREDMKKKK